MFVSRNMSNRRTERCEEEGEGERGGRASRSFIGVYGEGGRAPPPPRPSSSFLEASTPVNISASALLQLEFESFELERDCSAFKLLLNGWSGHADDGGDGGGCMEIG